jgi:molybdopterin converting factor small subunit
VTALRFVIPGPLRPFADGRGAIAVDAPAGTVADALEALAAVAPGVCDRVLTEQGDVRPHINLFVGGDNIRDVGGLAARVPDGAEITILPAVSGG